MGLPSQKQIITIIVICLVLLGILGAVVVATLMSIPGGVFSADWTLNPLRPLVGEIATFDVTLEGGPPQSYHWDFGDGNTSDERSPSHIFNRSGYCWVELIVDWGHGINASSGSLIGIQNHDINEVLTGNRITNPSRSGMVYDLIYFDIYDGITKPNITGRWSGTAMCRELDIFIMTNPSNLGPRLVSEDLGRYFGGFDVTREAAVPEDGALNCQYIMVLQVIGGTVTDYTLELTVEY